MAKNNVHIVKHAEGWAAKREGADRASKVTETQEEAIDAGRRITQRERGELVIHGRDGKIREKDSYGNDKHPPKG